MSLNVLLVEDEALQAMALKQTLQSLGHQVSGMANNSRQALKLNQTLEPDLILMDLQIPGEDGIETARLVNRTSQVPVIIMSSTAGPDLTQRAIDAQVRAFLVKPVPTHVLGHTLNSVIKNHQIECELQSQVDKLTSELTCRKNHSIAVGSIMDQQGLDEEAANHILASYAEEHGLSLKQAAAKLARDIVHHKHEVKQQSLG